MDEALQMNEEECIALMDRLFPDGPGGGDVAAALIAGGLEGWEASPLRVAFYPSVDQRYEEAVRMHRNMERMFKKKEGEEDKPDRPEPTREEIEAEHDDTPGDPKRELRELVGMCLWDVFSDNHEVKGPDGRWADLGSFRASAGFIAEWINAKLGHPPTDPEEEMRRMMAMSEAMMKGDFSALGQREERGGEPVYKYTDFYMGTQMIAHRTDLSPMYVLIFKRLLRADCDWKYTFPRLSLISFPKQPKEGAEDFEEYDPSAAFAEEEEERERKEETAKLREELDEAYRENVERARDEEPPTTVRAYRDVFGELPEGWPPVAEA